MASNYENEHIFLLECIWEDSTKLLEKYKFQGTKKGKAKVCIGGTLGMEFFSREHSLNSTKMVPG